MKMLKKLIPVCLLSLALVLPVKAREQDALSRIAEPLSRMPEASVSISTRAKTEDLRHPDKVEIAAQWNKVTSASTIFQRTPSVTAPYATGVLTEDFLESGVTYLNYVRFVAGLPAVELDSTLNEDAQHGAVLLAAIDELTHFPGKPADMDNAFYNRGAQATASSNISARWGYTNLTEMLQSAVFGCMNDNGSLGNLQTVGHRRWLLNPTLGKVGFGYAESATEWSYIVTKVFDESGPGCDYDFISWPVAGNHPTNLFVYQNPWSVTLNPDVYQRVSIENVKVSVTREADGQTWYFDSSTGEPNITNNSIAPYLTVDTAWYGVPNCIIFHPGSKAVESYEGVYRVKITGIYYKNGTAAELDYTVDFFDVESVSSTVTGDMNNDSVVNNDDVVALMWYVLFPEQYPISVSGDLNQDGMVNNNDVIALMWYVLFPEQYPLQ